MLSRTVVSSVGASLLAIAAVQLAGMLDVPTPSRAGSLPLELRSACYWLMNDGQFWMFAIYDKDKLENLTSDQEKTLKRAIDAELKVRGTL